MAVKLLADKKEQPHVNKLVYKLKNKGIDQLAVNYCRSDKNELTMASSEYKFVRNAGRIWPLDEPDKFYRIPDKTRARFQNAGFLEDFSLSLEVTLNSIYYLGPLRDHSKRMYFWSGETPDGVGQKGQFTVAAILAASEKNRKLNRGPKKTLAKFDEFIAQCLKDLGVAHSFRVKAIAEGRKEYEVLLKTNVNSTEVKLTDAGFGVPQVLPALVEAFYCPPNSTVWMEQPETYLSPQAQAELADVFISATKARENGKERNVQLIIESHSEHFLNRLQRRVAEEEIKLEDIVIYFCHQEGGKTELELLKLNKFGEIENWPENLFGDEMVDISARAMAAMKRKQSTSP